MQEDHPQKFLGPETRTEHGFPLVEFKDYYDTECSLQASSLALCEVPGWSAIWLGVERLDAAVMAEDAADVGIDTDQTTGWVKYPLPPQVAIPMRMHLEREQVEALVRHLQAWLAHGRFTNGQENG